MFRWAVLIFLIVIYGVASRLDRLAEEAEKADYCANSYITASDYCSEPKKIIDEKY